MVVSNHSAEWCRNSNFFIVTTLIDIQGGDGGGGDYNSNPNYACTHATVGWLEVVENFLPGVCEKRYAGMYTSW